MRVPAQRAAAPEEGQQVVRHVVVIVEDRLHAAAEREHPRFAQDGQVLDDLAVHALEAVGLVAVRIIGERDAVESARARVARRDAPVDRRDALGCGCTSGARRVPSRSWRRSSVSMDGAAPAPSSFLMSSYDHLGVEPRPRRRPESDVAGQVSLLDAEVGAIVLDRVHAGPVEANLRCVSPSDADALRQAAIVCSTARASRTRSTCSS